MTSKLQLTVPKAIAEKYGIRPGDHLEWIPAGKSIRVELARIEAAPVHRQSVNDWLASFKENVRWLNELQAGELEDARAKPAHLTRETRGWTREDLYNDERGLPRGFPR